MNVILLEAFVGSQLQAIKSYIIATNSHVIEVIVFFYLC